MHGCACPHTHVGRGTGLACKCAPLHDAGAGDADEEADGEGAEHRRLVQEPIHSAKSIAALAGLSAPVPRPRARVLFALRKDAKGDDGEAKDMEE